MRNLTTGIAGAALVLGVIIWYASPARQTAPPPTAGGGALAATETSFDFGTVSMAAGIVRHTFKISNPESTTVTVEKLYTSCMCTTATLKTAARTVGPFGMPGHGFIPAINEPIAGGETAEVEVAFDPAAHGPAGVGRVERIVYLENSSGRPLELKFSATVTP